MLTRLPGPSSQGMHKRQITKQFALLVEVGFENYPGVGLKSQEFLDWMGWEPVSSRNGPHLVHCKIRDIIRSQLCNVGCCGRGEGK